MEYKPQTFTDAEFSLPYTYIMVLLQKPPLEWARRRNYEDPQILELMQKVTAKTDPEAQERYLDNMRRTGETLLTPTTVELETKDGAKFRGYAERSKGTLYNPQTPQELEAKFRHLTSPFLGQERAEALLKSILNLESASNLSEIAAHLREARNP